MKLMFCMKVTSHVIYVLSYLLCMTQAICTCYTVVIFCSFLNVPIYLNGLVIDVNLRCGVKPGCVMATTQFGIYLPYFAVLVSACLLHLTSWNVICFMKLVMIMTVSLFLLLRYGQLLCAEIYPCVYIPSLQI